MWLNTFISAVIAIISFSLALSPNLSTYYEVPMGIIGKVYANSMLVLINSRMVLGSEEAPTPSRKVISTLRFGTAPAHPTDSADMDGNIAVYTRAGAAPSGGSGPEAV